MVDVDTLLYELEQDIRNAEVRGSFLARIWVGTGMQAAADVVERKRIEILCEGIVSNVEQVSSGGGPKEQTTDG